MLDLLGSTIYEFGVFRLDTQSRRLFRHGEKRSVSLTPKAVEVLMVLVQNRSRLVTKDELLDTVWAGSFVEESNLTQTVFVLRKTLGDDPKDPQFILTVPNRGYQFIGDVTEVDVGDEILDAGFISEKRPAGDVPKQNARSRPIFITLASVIAVAMLIAAGYRFYPTAATPEIKTIAILPFEDLSEQQTDRYLGISLADGLARQFGSLKQLTVRPVQSVLKYAGRADHQAVGRELQVDAVVVGRVQRAADRVRLNIQLVRVVDNSVVWTDIFDEVFTNFFSVQDSMSKRIATSLAVQMDERERQRFEQRGTSDPEAYQAYMRGRYFWNKRTPENLKKAIDEFERATREDPTFARAFSGLADCHQLLPEYWAATPAEAFPKAKAAAIRAIELDGDLAEAHTSLAYTQAFYEWDWRAAEGSFKRALELNPKYSTAHQWYGEYLTAVGRFDTARTHYDAALQIDPTSLILMTEVASVLHVQRNYEAMMEQAKRIIEADPNFAYAYFYLALGYEAKGSLAEAVDAHATMFSLFGEPADVAAEVREAFARDGMRGFWQKRQQQIATRPHLKHFPAFTTALVQLRAGDHEAALRSIKRSIEMREHNVVYSKYLPDLDPLRGDPRFDELLGQIGL